MFCQFSARIVFLKNYEILSGRVWNKGLSSKIAEKSDCEDKFKDERLIETKPLSGFVYNENIQGYKSKWRLPFIERKNFFLSKLGAFSTKKFTASLTLLNPDNFKYHDWKKWWQQEKKQKLAFDQQFNEERLMVLGCHLAAAHFTVYRGGAIKFVGHDRWIKDDKKTMKDYDDYFPNHYDPNYTLEAIDFSNTKIVYEGLKNIDNLESLKWLSFSNCAYFDDWCLDRISGEHRNNLEYLDISFTKVTHCGLHALYRFNKLRHLKIDETNNDPLFFQTCLEIKKQFKGLHVELVSTPQAAIASDQVLQIGP